MKDIMLEILCSIVGLSAASGLHYEENKLYIVCDNSNYLNIYNLPQKSLEKHLLYNTSGQNENVSKKDKLDLESLFKFEDSLSLLGSMSTPSRTKNFHLPLSSLRKVKFFSTKTLSKNIGLKLGIDHHNLNIEGSFLNNDTLYLFNRGNGPSKKNGIILAKADFRTPIRYIDIALPPQKKGIPAFTDAILVDGKIYFIAAIEQTESTYEDGHIGGSFLGSIDLGTFSLRSFLPISDIHKFEGITLYQETPKQLTFLLCEDSDQHSTETTIYKLSITR